MALWWCEGSFALLDGVLRRSWQRAKAISTGGSSELKRLSTRRAKLNVTYGYPKIRTCTTISASSKAAGLAANLYFSCNPARVLFEACTNRDNRVLNKRHCMLFSPQPMGQEADAQA